ncbi:hypothetical protein F9L16_13115 [Agarivorans sp. B2Z047]|uniref:hypothetical protein n=1 Tax=Agarivorans sp. B2Z047 TaxID=2652721 RepID=UPI00128CB857|nr:hypothetical protein [Agarivorans sp. B2Z047]MPW29930.1 hypothetical protein [Agarivorans sp. B2Z047]UQN43497.1 hypothetical protein LQZ07_03180 [Agarivorans sp. B2Z047]
MKIEIHCLECFQNNVQIGKPYRNISLSEIRDDGVYHNKCPQGHETTTILDSLKFEVLFDIGMNAICDGYNREAISSFSASLERFYETYIRYRMNVDKPGSPISSIWKAVSNQSERQLGAFIFIYATQHGVPPALLPSDSKTTFSANFRNNVIHKGYIPSKQEALIYAEGIYSLLQRYIQEIEASDIDQFIEFYRSQLPSRRKSTPAQNNFITSTKAFSMTLLRNETRMPDFDYIKAQFYL